MMDDNQTRVPAVGRDGEPPALGEFDQHEIYPMPMFATVAARDVDQAAEWYQRALGFATVFRAPAPAGQASPLVHLRRRKYQDLLVVPSRRAVEDPEAAARLRAMFDAARRGGPQKG
jgi:hypothetical protein